MKKVLMVILSYCFFSLVTFAQSEAMLHSLESILPQDIARELFERNKLQTISYGDNHYTPTMMPQTQLGLDTKKSWTADKNPVFIVESLYLLKKNDANSDIERVSKIVRSISSLKGTQYYSHSRKKMRELYQESYVIQGKEDKTPISDPIDGNAEGKTILAIQKDSTFGKFMYEYSYRQTETEVAFLSTNLETLWYGIFKLIDSEKLKVSLVVSDLGTCLVTYVLFQADFVPLSAFENKITNSLTARTDAIYTWFENQYYSQAK